MNSSSPDMPLPSGREFVAQNVAELHEERLTFGQRVSDRLASVAGSWAFICSFGLFLALWITLNYVLMGKQRFDPYPFILLNLVLSCIAAIQAPIIMMSQNRQEARDRLRDEQDFAVNLKAEREVADLQQDIAHLQAQVTELTTLQQQALGLLQQMQAGPRQ